MPSAKVDDTPSSPNWLYPNLRLDKKEFCFFRDWASLDWPAGFLYHGKELTTGIRVTAPQNNDWYLFLVQSVKQCC